VLIVTVDGDVLLARNERGWGTAGGHVEAGDGTLRDTAAREAWEELGLALDPLQLEPLSLVVDAREVVPGCAHWDFCFVLLVASPVEPSAGSDVRETAWYSFDRLPEVNAHMQRHLDAARARLRSGARRSGPHVSRVAARAVIQRDGRLLLLRSGPDGDVTFPGGGVEEGETLHQALSRELVEECGRQVIDCGPVLLTYVDSRADRRGPGIFTMHSHYLACTVGEQDLPLALEPYERELDLRPTWLTVEKAISINLAALATGRAHPWVARGLSVLRHLRGAGVVG
jgi:8-oxo-dGTP pyrophosphatase MutT (NUDIX family)